MNGSVPPQSEQPLRLMFTASLIDAVSIARLKLAQVYDSRHREPPSTRAPAPRHAKTDLRCQLQKTGIKFIRAAANVAQGAANAVDGATCKFRRIATLHPRPCRVVNASCCMAGL